MTIASPTTTGPTATATSPAETLRGLCAGAVQLPGDPGYDAARTPWNVAVDQRPAAVAHPATAEDVSAVVRAAAAAGLRVAPQGTGHNAGPLGDLSQTVLLRTSEMTGVTVDAEERVARVEAGVLWSDVVEACAPYGLAALHGSSPDVGVVGYCLGGGIGWYARQLGMAANSLLAAELVLADGTLVRADAEHHAEVFWALRGGGGNFGIVTALELRLFDVATTYAGMLLWDQSRAAEVLPVWAAWTETAPDCVSTSFRMLNLPPLPELPPFLRGRQLVVIDGAVLAEDAEAERELADLRALSPEIDSFARVPAASIVRLHMDPEGPTPGVSDSTMLAELPAAAVESFLALTGPGSGSTLLSAELRQLGGALSRPAEGAGALPCLDGRFVLFAVAVAATPERAAQGRADAVALVDALSSYSSGRDYLNFAEVAVDAGKSFPEATWQRLRRVRSAVDPTGRLVANHQVPGLGDTTSDLA